MSGLIGGLNWASETWWPWVFHAGWQAAALGLAVLLVERLARRWPSPIRYWLLVLALLKFAVPPTTGAAIGLFGWVGPMVHDRASWVEQGHLAAASAATRADHGIPAALPTSRGAASVPLDLPETTPKSFKPLTAAATVRPMPSWRAWLMLLHLAGTAVVALWIARQWVGLVLMLPAAERVTEGPLYERFRSICRRMGLRHLPRLLVTPEENCPYSFGLLRPAVAVPRALAERLSEEDLQTALAHEAGHHRRGDLWINALQVAICTVWWFHPVAWILNGALRRVREECCDDLLLAGDVVTAETYCDMLLRVAAQEPSRLRSRLVLSMADGLHPLGRRFGRIMDATLRRPTGVRLPGILLLLVLAVTLLPGLRTSAGSGGRGDDSATPTERTGIAADAPADPAASETSTKPADDRPLRYAEAAERVARAELESAQEANRRAPGAVPPSELRRLVGQHRRFQLEVARLRAERKRADDVKIFSGRVVDESDKPVPGAHVWYPVTWMAPRGRLSVDAPCDAEGRFTLAVPAAWLDQPDRTRLLWEVWALAEGRSMGTASVYKHVFSPEEAGELKIVLGPPADTSFVVLDPDGKPITGVVLEPRSFLTPTAYCLVPEPMLPQLRATTDGEGRASMPGVPGGGLYRVVLRSNEFGEQLQVFRDPKWTPAKGTIRLRMTGRIEGRVIADDPELARGRTIVLTTSESAVHPPQTLWPTEGYARVVSDRNGKFVVPSLAEGALHVEIGFEKVGLPVRPRLPEGQVVPANKSTEVEIRFVPAVPVEGVVRMRGTNEPVEGTAISLRYGTFLQGDLVVSDAAGRFATHVLPGKVEMFLISVPGNLMPATGPHGVTCRVPDVTTCFTLPPLEVVRVDKIDGRLVDAGGEPVTGAVLSIKIDGRVVPMTRTRDGGRFVGGIPAGSDVNACEFSVVFRTIKPYQAEVLQREPLVLRLRPADPESNGRSMEGQIVDEQGRPVAGAEATFSDADIEFQAITGADGRFVTPPVFVARKLRFVAKAAGYADSQGDFDLARNAESAGDLKIVLRRAPASEP